MQAGRELDAKVAEALGYKREERKIAINADPVNGYVIGERWYNCIPHFSTTWEDMGVLVEEARKQGICLDFSHALNGGYYAFAGRFVKGEYKCFGRQTDAVPTAQLAVCLAFLKAKGIAI